jgi:hypothetical protein
VAEGAAHFAGELVLDGFFGRVVPFQVVVAVGEVDVLFVEYGGPLEGCSCDMINFEDIGINFGRTYRAEFGTWCNGIVYCLEARGG